MNEQNLKREYNFQSIKVIDIYNRINGLKTSSKDISNLIVPEYQRDYVWKESNVSSLLVSLYKNFPIGIIIETNITKNNNSLLIDGLQRYFSIVKIFNNPLPYLKFDIFEYWYNKKYNLNFEKLNLFDKNVKSFKSNFKKYLNDKKHNKEISLSESDLHYKDYFDLFFDDFDNWHKNEFKDKLIPHFKLTNYNEEDISEIFSSINKNGVHLSKFEIISSSWNLYNIKLEKELKFINSFHSDRVKKYKYKLGANNNFKYSFDNKKPICSNFIYALFVDIFNDKELEPLKNTFLSKEKMDNENFYFFIKDKAIEPICEILKHTIKIVFDSKLDINTFSLEKLGKEISKYIKDEKSIDKLKMPIIKSIKMTINKIPELKAKSNSKNSYFIEWPVWLVTVFIIYSLNKEVNSEYHRIWFLKEFLIDNKLSSGTGNKAKKIIKDKTFSQKYDNLDEFVKNIQNVWDDEKEVIRKASDNLEITKENKNFLHYTNSKKLCWLSIIQNKFEWSSSYNVDHIIPKSFYKSSDKNLYDYIYNLQILGNNENNKKSNNINKDNIKDYDFLYKEIKKDSDKSKLLLKYNEIVYENELKKDEKNIIVTNHKILFNFFEMRKKLIDEMISNEIKEWVDKNSSNN